MRRMNDAYYTPSGILNKCLGSLSAQFPTQVQVVEPFAGDGRLVHTLEHQGYHVIANDVNGLHPHLYDMSHEESWAQMRVSYPDAKVVVSNPPYGIAPQVVRCAMATGYDHILFLLRLSWLERCKNRADIFDQQKLRRVLITPRLSFTDDGRKDCVTTAWFWFDCTGVWSPALSWL